MGEPPRKAPIRSAVQRRPFSLAAVAVLAVIGVVALVAALFFYRQAVLVTIAVLVLMVIVRRRDRAGGP
jgi:hypothetical protein